MDLSLVYRKSGLGAAELASNRDRALSPRERCVLILLNGRRTIGELCDLFGAETVGRVVPELESMGFAKQVDPDLPDEWATAVTQFREDPAENSGSGPARRRPSESHFLAWMTLATVLAFSVSVWATNRYLRRPDTELRLDRSPLARALPIDANGLLTSSDASGQQHLVPTTAEKEAAPTVAEPVAAAVVTDPAERPSPQAAPVDHSSVLQTESLAASAARAPAVEVAMAAPAAQPAKVPVSLRPLRHEPPKLPEQALHDGISESQARVRLWVTPEGTVDQVDILESTHSGVFDDEVRRALSVWTFEPPGRPTEQVLEVTLKP